MMELTVHSFHFDEIMVMLTLYVYIILLVKRQPKFWAETMEDDP